MSNTERYIQWWENTLYLPNAYRIFPRIYHMLCYRASCNIFQRTEIQDMLSEYRGITPEIHNKD
jgi:hypothetical protein